LVFAHGALPCGPHACQGAVATEELERLEKRRPDRTARDGEADRRLRLGKVRDACCSAGTDQSFT
jgi:hypothetical protein